eukprot:5926189-Amphidinium_carterae.3
MSVRKAFVELHRETLDKSTASASDEVVFCEENVSFEGMAGCNGRRIPLSDLHKQGGLNRVVSGINRVVIELCCEPNSLLGCRAPRGTLVVRVTQEDDLNNPGVRSL